MIAKKVYPTIFTPADGVVLVEVPDLEILTEGKDYAEAVSMARDAIGLKGISLEDAKLPIPEPSDIAKVDASKGTFADEGEGYVSLVDIDFMAYRRRVDTKTVRRNVTLPNWLNQEAEAAHINVSKLLQEALMNRLGVSKY
jgi:predicted RNase H-like HicB family nuclease